MHIAVSYIYEIVNHYDGNPKVTHINALNGFTGRRNSRVTTLRSDAVECGLNMSP